MLKKLKMSNKVKYNLKDHMEFAAYHLRNFEDEKKAYDDDEQVAARFGIIYGDLPDHKATTAEARNVTNDKYMYNRSIQESKIAEQFRLDERIDSNIFEKYPNSFSKYEGFSSSINMTLEIYMKYKDDPNCPFDLFALACNSSLDAALLHEKCPEIFVSMYVLYGMLRSNVTMTLELFVNIVKHYSTNPLRGEFICHKNATFNMARNPAIDVEELIQICRNNAITLHRDVFKAPTYRCNTAKEVSKERTNMTRQQAARLYSINKTDCVCSIPTYSYENRNMFRHGVQLQMLSRLTRANINLHTLLSYQFRCCANDCKSLFVNEKTARYTFYWDPKVYMIEKRRKSQILRMIWRDLDKLRIPCEIIDEILSYVPFM